MRGRDSCSVDELLIECLATQRMLPELHQYEMTTEMAAVTRHHEDGQCRRVCRTLHSPPRPSPTVVLRRSDREHVSLIRLRVSHSPNCSRNRLAQP